MLIRFSSKFYIKSQGGTRSIHDGGSDVFFGYKLIFTFGIFLGEEISHVLF